MEISKNALKLLKYANKHESVNFEECYCILKRDIHTPYEWEIIDELKNQDFVITTSQMMPEGYRRNMFRITPSGVAFLENYTVEKIDKWFMRGLSFAAFIISVIALLL